MTSNEQTNRLLKALRFYDLLRQHGITSDQVRLLPVETWKQLAPHAGSKDEPHEQTVDMIVTLMAHREQNPLAAA